MEQFASKVWQALSDPAIMIPVWGAVGGAIRMAFGRPVTILTAFLCLILGAVFAHLGTVPLIMLLGLPNEAQGAAGAVIGITSYGTAKGLAELNLILILKSRLSK